MAEPDSAGFSLRKFWDSFVDRLPPKARAAYIAVAFVITVIIFAGQNSGFFSYFNYFSPAPDASVSGVKIRSKGESVDLESGVKGNEMHLLLRNEESIRIKIEIQGIEITSTDARGNSVSKDIRQSFTLQKESERRVPLELPALAAGRYRLKVISSGKVGFWDPRPIPSFEVDLHMWDSEPSAQLRDVLLFERPTKQTERYVEVKIDLFTGKKENSVTCSLSFQNTQEGLQLRGARSAPNVLPPEPLSRSEGPNGQSVFALKTRTLSKWRRFSITLLFEHSKSHEPDIPKPNCFGSS